MFGRKSHGFLQIPLNPSMSQLHFGTSAGVPNAQEATVEDLEGCPLLLTRSCEVNIFQRCGPSRRFAGIGSMGRQVSYLPLNEHSYGE